MRVFVIILVAAGLLCMGGRGDAATTKRSKTGKSSGSPSQSSSSKSKTSGSRSKTATSRGPLAELEDQIDSARDRLSRLNDSEKALLKEIAAQQKLLESQRAWGGGADSAGSPGAKQSATSATLAAQRRVEADLAVRIQQLDTAVVEQSLAARADQGSGASRSLTLHVLAQDAAKARQERATLSDSIRQNEQMAKPVKATPTPSPAPTPGGKVKRNPEAEKTAVEIKQLERDLEKVRADRKTYQDRIENLTKERDALKKPKTSDTSDKSVKSDKSAKSDKGQKQTTTKKPTGVAKTESSKPQTTPKISKSKDSAKSPTRSTFLPTFQEGTGLDLMVPEGTAVHAIESGEVLFAGRFKGYGNLVILEHPDGVLSLYGFLNEIRVSEKSRVPRGQIIGASGILGDKDRAGLRFELRAMRSGQEVTIDPRSWLPKTADFQRRVLKGTD